MLVQPFTPIKTPLKRRPLLVVICLYIIAGAGCQESEYDHLPELSDNQYIDSIHAKYLLQDIDNLWQLDTVYYVSLEEPYAELTKVGLGSSYRATERWINNSKPEIHLVKWRGLVYDKRNTYLEGELDIFTVPQDTPYVVRLHLEYNYSSSKYTAAIDTIVDVSLDFFSEGVVRNELFAQPEIDKSIKWPQSLEEVRRILTDWHIPAPTK
jgi:hypothetical protein